jgi:hypothetical protein
VNLLNAKRKARAKHYTEAQAKRMTTLADALSNFEGFVNLNGDGILASEGKVNAAAVSYSVAPSHPFGPPKVVGNTITVEAMLKSPTRITRMIMDLTAERFIADRLFANGGSVTGGAVIFDAATENELYTSRDIEQVAVAGEFPLIGTEATVPNTALVEKWGGKTFIADEARDRNDSATFTRMMRQLGNVVVRKLNQRAVETVNAALADGSRDVIGNDWSSYDPEVDPPQDGPAYDFGRADMIASTDEMGADFNLWVLNPQEVLALVAIYGSLTAPGIPPIYSSPRQTAGEAIVCQSQGCGQTRIEKPLGTETWREQKTERTWVQASVRPMWFVDNKFVLLRYKGLDGTP